MALALGWTLTASLGWAPTPAAGASLAWSGPYAVAAAKQLSGVSCTSESSCVAVSHEGDVLVTSDPTASSPGWSQVDLGEELNAVSCAPAGPCVAVDAGGDAWVNPSPGSSSWTPTPLAGAPKLTGVSCAGASLCVAVDEAGDVWTSTSPDGGGWTATKFGAEHRWTAVSCAASSVCVAVDGEGAVAATADPTGGTGAWHEARIAAGALSAVSCPSSTLCVAVDESGGALASADPDGGSPSWTVTTIDGGERLTGVSCVPQGLCVAVDGAGRTLASTDASAAIPAWSESGVIDAGPGFTGAACLPSGFCMAVDAGGEAVDGRVPAPGITPLAPSQLTSASAVLAGAVEPNGSALVSCAFELGPGPAGGGYTESIPCSQAPTAIVGRTEVSAQVGGLQPNTTYHYRLTAADATETGFGEGEAFTTPVSSAIPLVLPHPSITGTPAVGRLLTCHPGTPAGTQARLAYTWVRNLIPIPDADAATYTVVGQDAGHHLQCQVTATDGGGSATAKSAFVSIPIGGVPAAAGETVVGGATFAHGRVSVPIACSSRASDGCRVALRLVTVEALAGGRVVSVAAQAPRHGHGAAAALRHVTVTLASLRVRLSTGAHTTLTIGVGATGRRLLASVRRFSADLYVSGTVIGAIESQLARELVTLGSPGHTARHGKRRR